MASKRKPDLQAVRPALGVLMLDTRFPRWPGDIGCAQGMAGDIRRVRVEGAAPRRVVTDARALAGSALARDFGDAAVALQAGGAGVVTTSCGFLVLLQAVIQARLDVPFVSSSLLQLPALLAREPQVGVLTIDAGALGAAHFAAAGVAPDRLADLVVQGLDPDGDFARPILRDEPERDVVRAERELVEAALALRRRAPALRTVVLECTNMPPHAAAIAAATGLDVQGLHTDLHLAPWFDEAIGRYAPPTP